MVDGLKHDGYLEEDKIYWARAQTLPQNTNADGNGGAIEASGVQGGIECIVRCSTAISIADTKTLTIKMLDGASASSMSDVPELDPFFTVTASGAAQTYAVGDELARITLPTNIRRYTKVNITTDDAAASGAVDVITRVIPH